MRQHRLHPDTAIGVTLRLAIPFRDPVFGTFAARPRADRGYPVAHERTPAGHRAVAARRDARPGPGWRATRPTRQAQHPVHPRGRPGTARFGQLRQHVLRDAAPRSPGARRRALHRSVCGRAGVLAHPGQPPDRAMAAAHRHHRLHRRGATGRSCGSAIRGRCPQRSAIGWRSTRRRLPRRSRPPGMRRSLPASGISGRRARGRRNRAST